MQDELQTILITGGCGFVGSTLAMRFRRAFPRARIAALDNLRRRGSAINAGRLEDSGVRVMRGDVRERRVLMDAGPCDLIVDAAAEPSVLAGLDGDAGYVADTNLGGTLNVLECARAWRAALLFLSSSRVYPVGALRAIRLRAGVTRLELAARQTQPGVSRAGIAENFTLEGSRTLYGATKYASEIMAAEYAHQFDLPILIDRCGVLAGPWQMGRTDQGIVGLWVARHLYGRPLTVFGYGGKQVRDVLHAEDLADLVIAQLAARADWHGQVYGVGGGAEISFSLLELTEMARAATGREAAISFDDGIRSGDVPLFITDTARLRAAFDWRPQRDAAAIVADTAEWMRAHQALLEPVLAGEA